MSIEEKFHAAVNVIRGLPKNGSYQPSNALMLRFYAYFKQATLGPCKGSRPAFWDVVGRAKYDAWIKLDDMKKEEAMSNYVSELHRIVETMSYTDNVANFLEAQQQLDSISIDDLELVAGDVIERVRSQPNSPFASRDPSPQRIRSSSLETSPATSPSISPPPQPDTDHSDDEYIDTIDSPPEAGSKKSLQNGYMHGDNIPNGHIPKERQSRSKAKMTPTGEITTNHRVDISQDVLRTIQNMQSDIDRLSAKVTNLDKTKMPKKGRSFSLQHLSPTLLAFIILWPFFTHTIMRYWANRK